VSGSPKLKDLLKTNLERLSIINALFESGLDSFRLAKYLIIHEAGMRSLFTQTGKVIARVEGNST
jgi:hypothetical protein